MKKYNKIITLIFTVIFITVFSYFYLNEYKAFHLNKTKLKNDGLDLQAKLQNFTLDQIKEIDDIQFYSTPFKGLIDEIIRNIANAKKEIFLETYILTEKRIQNALIKAHKKGIQVKIILEKSPYKAYNINNKAFDKMTKAGLKIIWSNKNNYSFNHSKVLLVDNLSIISTGNYSYSTFTKNRDFFLFTTDLNINNKLKENFNNDYIGVKKNIYDDNLIFSPSSSRIKFLKLFNSAEKNIKMYFQYFKDDKLVNELIRIKKEKNIEIDIIIAQTAENDKNIQKLKTNGFNITILKKEKMHAKAILVDESYLFIGSINFSNYSIDKNREQGILLKNKDIIEKFLKVFKKDVQNNI